MAQVEYPRAITEIVRRISTQFNPDKIILFGSYARNEAHANSDADVLVIMPVQGSRRRQATLIDQALMGVDLPADIFVVTPQELERDREQIGTLIHPALKEGKVLYERPQ